VEARAASVVSAAASNLPRQRSAQAAAAAAAARKSLAALDREIAAGRAAERAAGEARSRADVAVQGAERIVAGARSRWGERVPDGPEYAETEQPGLIERRELSAPWADDEFSQARTCLFLAALALHKAFLLNAGPRLSRNLSAMMNILDGKGRPGREPLLAAWQTLFLVVPVVSTTFASFGRMFAGLGRESLGWLLAAERGRRAVAQPSRGPRLGDTSQGALEAYRPFWNALRDNPSYKHNGSPMWELEDYIEHGSALVGSPQQVADKLHRFSEIFRQQLSTIQVDALPLAWQEQQLARFAAEVAPTVRDAYPDTLWQSGSAPVPGGHS